MKPVMGGGFVVKKKRFAVEQITAILHQAQLGTSLVELCRQHSISEQSFYRWKKQYGSMLPSEARELKQLREEQGLSPRDFARQTLRETAADSHS